MIKVYVDFEMNMDNSKGKKDIQESDIIAIGAIKYNTKTGYIEEFKSLIKPISTELIYPHIEQLTHIKQKDIDNAPMYEEVMRKFKKWLGDYSIIEGIYTFGNLDYTCFNNTDKKSSIKYNHPRFINNIKNLFIDIKDKYMNYGIKCVNYVSLKNLLMHVNIEFEGEAHDPLNDAYNLFILDKNLENNKRLRELLIIRDFIKPPFTILNPELEYKFELYQTNVHNGNNRYNEDDISKEILSTIRKYVASIKNIDVYNIEDLKDISKKLSVLDKIKNIEEGYFYLVNNIYFDLEDLLEDLMLYRVNKEEYREEIENILDLFDKELLEEEIEIGYICKESC